MSWTDERVENLKSMWNEGLSASQIAQTLGGVSRNAVIGKVHRLGLSNRSPAAKPVMESEAQAAPTAEPLAAETASPTPAPEPADPAPAQKAPAGASATPRREPPTPSPAALEDAARTAETLATLERKAMKLSLLDLTERTCKWPIGDPATEDFYFCGLPCAAGKPYCESHVAVAFQPMSSRRDRDRSRGAGGRR